MIDELEKLRQLTKTITSNGFLTDQTNAWRYAFNSVKELVCITNPSFQIKFINKPLEKKLNIKSKTYLNKDLAYLFNIEVFSVKGRNAVIGDNSIYYGAFYIEELGGWYERHRHHIETATGKLIGYTFMLIDITARKETQLKLEENEKLLEGILDAIPDIISVQDNNYNIIKYNKAGLEAFKLTSSSIKGKKCYEMPGRGQYCDNCQTRICKVTKVPAKMDKFIEELDGWYDCRSYPLLDDDGNVSKVIEHLRYIGDKKEKLE